MKILIVGASGLVGSAVLRVGRQRGHDLVGTRLSRECPGLLHLDVADGNAVVQVMEDVLPEAVVYCAAWPWVDGCEQDPDRAFLHNARYPSFCARLAGERGVRFVYISTSYVFDGTCGPYSESERPNPINVYGHSKLAGESACLEAAEGRVLVIRTMGVYGEEVARKNFLYQVFDTLSDGRAMRVPFDQLGNATHADDLATMILLLLEADENGIWNAAGSEHSLARSDFALRIARHYGLDGDLIEPVETSVLGQLAPRPMHGGLRVDRIAGRFGLPPSPSEFPVL